MSAYEKEQLIAAMREVYAAFDMTMLQTRCQQHKKDLFLALKGKLVGSKNNRYAFRNNDCRILAVSHLDTVQQGVTFGTIAYPNETLVFNPRLDDRLGAYTILDLLPRIGVATDILFSDNEECGQTTAAHFKSDKKYNWIVSFDRRGEDVVTYQYTWDNVLREYFTVGHGSFSCIGRMDHLGCQAMNVGVGYQDEHSQRAFFILEEYIRNVARFLLFYRRYYNVRFPYTKQVYGIKRYRDHEWPIHNRGVSHLDHARSVTRPQLPAPVAAAASTGESPPNKLSDVKQELINAKSNCVAFCEVCWAARTWDEMHVMVDFARCKNCGQILELILARGES